MPTKVERRVASLPAGLLPLLSQKELETYYGVSDWTVRQWLRDGMPREPFGARGFRFDLNRVRDWMAKEDQVADRESAPPAPENVPARPSRRSA